VKIRKFSGAKIKRRISTVVQLVGDLLSHPRRELRHGPGSNCRLPSLKPQDYLCPNLYVQATPMVSTAPCLCSEQHEHEQSERSPRIVVQAYVIVGVHWTIEASSIS